MPHKNPEEGKAYRRRRHLLRTYDLTVEQYDAMLAAQGGHCKLCDYVPNEGYKSLHVDHDHATGEVRGLLCCGCNRYVIGTIDRIGIEKVAAYLGYKAEKCHL